MNEQQNLQTVRDAYAAFTRGDIQGVLDVCADDIEWETPGPSQIPYAGIFHGKEDVAEFFRILAQTDDVEQFQPQRFFADGDMVIVLGRYAARVKSTGKSVTADWVHAFTMRGGKVARWREYLDTASYAKAYEQTAARV
jgi:ketosteroid isomerase-like protein